MGGLFHGITAGLSPKAGCSLPSWKAAPRAGTLHRGNGQSNIRRKGLELPPHTAKVHANAWGAFKNKIRKIRQQIRA
jgi:hypothetical protein